MKILIDGNNLLHASDVFPQGADPSASAPHRALVAFLVSVWTPAETRSAVIVFDGKRRKSKGSAEELPNPSDGPRILFPQRKQDADEVLEQALQAEPEPTRLLVVSSDHRIQRAARQVGADYVDSEVYWQMIRRRQAKLKSQTIAEKPEVPDALEAENWLKSFQASHDPPRPRE